MTMLGFYDSAVITTDIGNQSHINKENYFLKNSNTNKKSITHNYLSLKINQVFTTNLQNHLLM